MSKSGHGPWIPSGLAVLGLAVKTVRGSCRGLRRAIEPERPKPPAPAAPRSALRIDGSYADVLDVRLVDLPHILALDPRWTFHLAAVCLG